MDPADVEALIEAEIEEAHVEVRRARGEHDDDHLAVTVISPAFEGEPLVDQHRMVYDALGEHMTTAVHALEVETYAPGEADEGA